MISEVMQLSDILFCYFQNTELRYTGTVFGEIDTDDPVANTGLEWIGLLYYMMEDFDDLFLDVHPAHSGANIGFYIESGDIWYRSPQVAPERVFEVLEERTKE